jgi:soluble epoxide hydrolase/lipid-phosphate phosphatase
MMALWLISSFLWALAACLTVHPALETKRFTTSDGLTYVYDYSPAQGDNPTLLLLHGFPATRRDWDFQIPDFLAAGYGVIVPDIIGFGESDRPLEIDTYNLKTFGNHFVELIDELGLDTVVGAGHDWGAVILSSMAVFHPKRFSKFIFLSVGYIPPGSMADIDGLNKMTLEQLGYLAFGYWYFFNTVDAASLCEANLESCYHMFYPSDKLGWPNNFGDLGAARKWLTEGKLAPLPEYALQKEKEQWMETFGQPGTMETAMNFYKAIMRGVNYAHEKDLTPEDWVIHVPVLTISGTLDTITQAEVVKMQTEPLVKSEYTAGTVEAGHWPMREQKKDVSSLMLEFVASS